jgi:hypothetical protein
VLPVGIGLRDPRSQKRDLGHPSISPFDIAEGTSFVISFLTCLSESAAPTARRGASRGEICGSCSRFDLPLTLQHLHMDPSRKISKFKAISIKLTPVCLRYFRLVRA